MYGDIYNFLVHQTSFYSGQQMKAYKSLESYNLYTSGWVVEVLKKELHNHTILMVAKVGKKHLQSQCDCEVRATLRFHLFIYNWKAQLLGVLIPVVHIRPNNNITILNMIFTLLLKWQVKIKSLSAEMFSLKVSNRINVILSCRCFPF